MQFLDRDSFIRAMPALQTLFARAFGRALDAETLLWRYADHPAGDVLFCVETDGERIIASYSASPVVMHFDGDEVRTALSMTTMTDPDHAGRGLFPKLAGALYGEMARKGYRMIWGFPNTNSHSPIVRKLQWFDIYEVPTMRRPLRAGDATAAKLERDDSFLLDYSSIAQHSSHLRTQRTAAYLRWRYTRNPMNSYGNVVLQSDGRVNAYCVFKKFGDALDVIDLQTPSGAEALELLSQVIAWAAGEGLTAIQCWSPRHHHIHAACERLRFQNREPITYFGARVFGATDALQAAARQYDRWYIQMGDSDVY